MHTLIGFMVNDADRLACLLSRYRKEPWLRCADDIHGWGVGQYVADDTLLRIQPGSIHQDVSLSDLLGDKGTRLLVAHASLSIPPEHSIKDIHPFRWHQWMFAHGGELDLGDRRTKMLDALPQFLRRSRTGRLDGEILSLDFIAELHRNQLLDRLVKPEAMALCLRKVVEAVETSVSILATNGHALLAYRSGSPFGYCLFEGIDDCEICRVGDTYTRFQPLLKSHQQFKGICVSSQPFGTSEPWHEIPERQVLIVRSSLDFELITGAE